MFPFLLLTGSSKPSSYWDKHFKLLLSMLFFMACDLTSHKKFRVHLQYVKSWSLYREVASGTADKVFWF